MRFVIILFSILITIGACKPFVLNNGVQVVRKDKKCLSNENVIKIKQIYKEQIGITGDEQIILSKYLKDNNLCVGVYILEVKKPETLRGIVRVYKLLKFKDEIKYNFNEDRKTAKSSKDFEDFATNYGNLFSSSELKSLKNFYLSGSETYREGQPYWKRTF